MPILVIDRFEVIAVQYDDCERDPFLVVKPFLKALDILVEAALVSYGWIRTQCMEGGTYSAWYSSARLS